MSQMTAPTTLDAWVRRLGEEEFPLFAHTARSIAAMSTDDGSSTSELTQVILRDNTMTARVLKMANSVYYNPGGVRINTVSRSIVILGFDTVRNIALSIGLVETMLSGSRHDNALAELVRSFHAAVQAKELAEQSKLGNTEELFIAALLYRIGAVAFWCFPYGKADALEWQYHNTTDREEAERRVLGFTLRNLTLALIRDWHLSALLATALASGNSRERNLREVELAYRLANAVEQGWNHPEVTTVLHNIGSMLGRNNEWVTRQVYLNAQQAAKVMTDFGIVNTDRFIPPPPGETPEPAATTAAAPDPQLMLQLGILRELSALLSEKADLNLVLSTVLEGIYRGLKMDRVVLAMLDLRQPRLVARFVLGKERETLLQKFQVAMPPTTPVTGDGREQIFSHVLAQNEPVWIDRRTRQQLSGLFVPELQTLLGPGEFFVAPVRVQGQPRGVIFADRSPANGPLTEQEFLTFRHFCDHANIAFNLLSSEVRRP
ncbi:MAG: HDOD domain-containing protein [Gammaproteobacteria bacterium]|nr:HDOD domain-containing protein [Gammaproteobacteria bacterium]